MSQWLKFILMYLIGELQIKFTEVKRMQMKMQEIEIGIYVLKLLFQELNGISTKAIRGLKGTLIRKMQTIELFSGTESFSKVAKKRGHKTFSVEIDPKFNPTLCKDILELQIEDLPKNVDVLWASPPCTTFSVASLRHYWINGKPKNAKTWKGISIVLKTLDLIKELKKTNPNMIWFIENPRGMLRKQDFMQDINKNTISYCQYGDFRQKPTDIWNNCFNWKSKPICSPGSKCHQSAKRGEDRGTQYLHGSKARSEIPSALFEEIFNCIEDNNLIEVQEEIQKTFRN